MVVSEYGGSYPKGYESVNGETNKSMHTLNDQGVHGMIRSVQQTKICNRAPTSLYVANPTTRHRHIQ